MHHKSSHTGQAIVLGSLTGGAGRRAAHAFSIKSNSCFVFYFKLIHHLIGLLWLSAIPQALSSCFIKRELFGATGAEILLAIAGLALACACLAVLFDSWLANRDASWASFMASVISQTQEGSSLWLACQTVFGVDGTSLAVRTALNTQEISSVQRHRVSRITSSQALACFEIPLLALEVTCVAIKRSAVAALAWSLTRHAFVQVTIRICSKWTCCFTHHTIQEWSNSIWITRCALIAVLVVTFQAIAIAILAAICRIIIESLSWTPVDTRLFVQDDILGDCVAARAAL